MLIELTGHPCSGKTYVLSESQYKGYLFTKYKGAFRNIFLVIVAIKFIFTDKLFRDLLDLVLLSNDSFYIKFILILNIAEKYYYALKLKDSKHKLIIDEGAVHILFNLLCTDSPLVWDQFEKKRIFSRLPHPQRLILLKTEENIQIERLKNRGHKRMKNIHEFTRITRKISGYIEMHFEGNIQIANGLDEFESILSNE